MNELQILFIDTHWNFAILPLRPRPQRGVGVPDIDENQRMPKISKISGRNIGQPSGDQQKFCLLHQVDPRIQFPFLPNGVAVDLPVGADRVSEGQRSAPYCLEDGSSKPQQQQILRLRGDNYSFFRKKAKNSN